MFGAVAAGIPSFGDLAWKSPVRAVQVGAFPSQTTTAQTISRSGNGALPAVDGVTLALGDRVLVVSQTNGYVEGIYDVTALGSAGAPWLLTRSTDCDTADEMVIGATTYITEGTTWAGTTAVAGADWTPTTGDADWQPDPQLTYSSTAYAFDDTWTKTNPLATLRVTVVGAGGGGGGTQATSASQNASGSGGGGGATAIKTFLASELPATVDIVIGQGGSGNSGAAGDFGTESFFGPGEAFEVQGGGGGGGGRGNATTSQSRAIGGLGGEAFGGDINLNGGDGGHGMTAGGLYLPIGFGGSSSLGGLTEVALDSTGVPGAVKGGGGAGATADVSRGNRAGGKGANGIVIVEEWAIGRGSWT